MFFPPLKTSEGSTSKPLRESGGARRKAGWMYQTPFGCFVCCRKSEAPDRSQECFEELAMCPRVWEAFPVIKDGLLLLLSNLSTGSAVHRRREDAQKKPDEKGRREERGSRRSDHHLSPRQVPGPQVGSELGREGKLFNCAKLKSLAPESDHKAIKSAPDIIEGHKRD